jgi:AraC-like DNA-binding protein
MRGNFITIKPKDKIVAKHIAYYYFHSSGDQNFASTFTFYPNYRHAITIYKNSDVMLGASDSSIKPSETEKYTCMYAVNTSDSFKVHLSGTFYKIGIVFNPLGINNFINVPLCDVFNPPFSVFDYFGESLTTVVKNVYDEADADKKAALLDDFFAGAYVGFEQPVLKKALQEILNTNGAVRVEELSETLGVSRKTLLRLFKKHLSASVEEYKKLVMFRNALNYSQQATDATTLTDVALYSLYYDQAHYIKHFKAVTHHSPKELLSKLTQLGSQEAVYWHFED